MNRPSRPWYRYHKEGHWWVAFRGVGAGKYDGVWFSLTEKRMRRKLARWLINERRRRQLYDQTLRTSRGETR